MSDSAERWWPWDRLGLDPTPDVRAIKRVYAKLLRTHHPETDPAGYQSLREAYEAALMEAPYAQEPYGDEADDPPATDDKAPVPPPPPARGTMTIGTAEGAPEVEVPLFARARMKVESAAPEIVPEAAVAPRLAVHPAPEPNGAPPAAPPRLVVAPLPLEPPPDEPLPLAEDAADRLLAEIDALLTQTRKMRDVMSWSAILRRTEMDSIDVRHAVAAGTLQRLIRFAASQPWGAAALEEWHPETWRLVDSVFDWSGSEIALARYYGENDLDLVMRPLRRALPRPERPAAAAVARDPFVAFMRRGFGGGGSIALRATCTLLAPFFGIYLLLRKLVNMPWWGIVLLVIGSMLVRALAK